MMAPNAFVKPIAPNVFNIPTELLECDNWIETQLNRGAAPNWTKQPNWKPKTFQDAYKACSATQYVGMVFRSSHPYVIVDLDVASEGSHKSAMKNLTPQAIDLIEHIPTYIEKTKSGKGLHLHYKVKDKKQWPFNIKKVKEEFTGEIYVKKGFVIFTNNPHPDLSTPYIAEITFQELAKLIPSLKKAEVIDAKIPYQQPATAFHGGIKELTEMLRNLSPWPNPRIIRAYEGFEKQGYDSYDFWNKIICSVKDYCSRNNISGTDGLGLLDIWSQQDTSGSYDEKDSAGLTGFDAVKAKWDSYDPAKDKTFVSYKTVQMYAEICKMDWPIQDSKGHVIKHINNYSALIDYHNLSFEQNSYMEGHFRIKGDKDVKKKHWRRQGMKEGELYTTQELELFNYTYVQNEYPSAPPLPFKHATEFFRAHMNATWNVYNPIYEWITSEPFKGKSIERDFFKIFTYQRAFEKHADFFNQVLKKACMQLLKSFQYQGPFQQDTLMPILQGPEAIHKSTFIRLLLGPELGKNYFGVISEGVTEKWNRKDVELKLIRYAIVEIEEIDNQLKGDKSSALKALISNDKIYVRLPYGRQTKIFPRRCILIGSSNSDTFNLSRFGNRRTPILPLSYIDTSALLKINMQQLWAEWLTELKADLSKNPSSTTLWTLSKSQEALTNRLSSGFFAGSDADFILDEMFDWKHPFTLDYITRSGKNPINPNPHILFTLKELTSLVQEQAGISKKIKPGALRHSVKQRIAEWTGSTKEAVITQRPVTGFIEHGIFHYKDRKLYLMPPRITKFQEDEEKYT